MIITYAFIAVCHWEISDLLVDILNTVLRLIRLRVCFCLCGDVFLFCFFGSPPLPAGTAGPLRLR